MASVIGWMCIDGPYDSYYGSGSRWGMTGVAYGQTIPIPTLAPEPVIPVIGVGGCNSDTPYFCDAEQLFLPSIMREE